MPEYSDVARAFSSGATGYDGDRSKLIPHFTLLYEAALDLIRDWHGPENPKVLDIGAGTGLFASMVLKLRPDASVTLLDASDDMLERARTHFAGQAAVAFRVGDMSRAALGTGWDLVISSLAIHHLDDAHKRALFVRIKEALKPGGLFINVEQVLGPDPLTDERYERFWQRDIVANGATDAQIAAAAERMEFDRCASVEAQLQWMREAGFRAVDCSVKAWRFAVLTGAA